MEIPKLGGRKALFQPIIESLETNLESSGQDFQGFKPLKLGKYRPFWLINKEGIKSINTHKIQALIKVPEYAKLEFAENKKYIGCVWQTNARLGFIVWDKKLNEINSRVLTKKTLNKDARYSIANLTGPSLIELAATNYFTF
jgi:hypothetical protein